MRGQTYEITFLGQANPALCAEFDDCEVMVARGTTTLRTQLPDRGALTGLIQRINGLGLDVIDVSLVAPQAGPGTLEALIPRRMQGHGGTEEVPG